MKYRIIQVGNKFYPQYKGLWPFWSFYYGDVCSDELYYNSKNEAIQHLDTFAEKETKIDVKKAVLHSYP